MDPVTLSIVLFLTGQGINVSKWALDYKSSKNKTEVDDQIRGHIEKLRRLDTEEIKRLIEDNREEIFSISNSLSSVGDSMLALQEDLATEFESIKDKLAEFARAFTPPAISNYPIGYRDYGDIPLVGRNDEIEQFKNLSGDIILTGQPGAGKTFFLKHISNNNDTKFIISKNPDLVIQELQMNVPQTIILDDALGSQDVLNRLLHFRIDSGINFKLVAVCWPFEKDKLLSLTNGHIENVLELRLLGADEIVEVIKSYLDFKDWALQEIQEQASGRPGLALRLAVLVEKMGGEALRDGRAYIDLLDEPFKRRLDEKLVFQILALFSVGGSDGVPIKDVAEQLGKKPIEIQDTLYSLATGGVISEIGTNCYATIPRAFRETLLKKYVFTSKGGSLESEYWDIYNKLDSKQKAIETIIGAMHRGLDFDATKIISMVDENIESYYWNFDPWNKLASLDADWCRRIVELRPEHIQKLHGPGLYYIPEDLIPLLLDNAVGDARPRNSHPDTSVRILAEWIAHYDREKNDCVARRNLLLNATRKWHESSSDNFVLWEVIPICTSLNYSKSGSNPGSGRTFSWTTGIISKEDVLKLEEIWNQIVEIAKQHPPQDWSHLLQAMGSWLSPYVAHATIDEEYKESARAIIAKIFPQLLTVDNAPVNSLSQWGINHNLIKSDESRIDPNFETYSPRRNFNTAEDHKTMMERHNEAAKALGSEWALLDPHDVASRIVQFDFEIKQIGSNTFSLGHVIFSALSETATDIDLWIEEFINQNVNPSCLYPLLINAARNGHHNMSEWLQKTISIPQYEWPTIDLILLDDDLLNNLHSLIWGKLGNYSVAIGTAILRNEYSIDCIQKLVTHDNKELLMEVILSDFRSNKKPLLKNHKDMWLNTLNNCVDTIINDDSGIYDIEEIAREIPEVQAIIAKSILKQKESYYTTNEYFYEQLFSTLSAKDKLELLGEINPNLTPKITKLFINGDIQIFRRLLDTASLKCQHLNPLIGYDGSANWINMALMALDNGNSSSDIASVANSGGYSFVGNGVGYFQGRIESYSALNEHSDERIKAIGKLLTENANAHLSKCEREEEFERVYGIDGF